MKTVAVFFTFWYNFIVGDDWTMAAGVVIALLLSALLARAGLDAWWLLPGAVALLLGFSLWRATQKP